MNAPEKGSDPNAILKELREIVQEFYMEKGGGPSASGDYDEHLIELIDSLDTWLSKGGALPSEWDLPR